MKSIALALLLSLVSPIFTLADELATPAALKKDASDIAPTALVGIATVGSILFFSHLRANGDVSGDKRPVGGYLMGTLWLMGGLLSPMANANESRAHIFLLSGGMMGLSAYNFAALTDREVKPSKIFLSNLVGAGVFLGYAYALRQIFGEERPSALVVPSWEPMAQGGSRSSFTFTAEF